MSIKYSVTKRKTLFSNYLLLCSFGFIFTIIRVSCLQQKLCCNSFLWYMNFLGLSIFKERKGFPLLNFNFSCYASIAKNSCPNDMSTICCFKTEVLLCIFSNVCIHKICKINETRVFWYTVFLNFKVQFLSHALPERTTFYMMDAQNMELIQTIAEEVSLAVTRQKVFAEKYTDHGRLKAFMF